MLGLGRVLYNGLLWLQLPTIQLLPTAKPTPALPLFPPSELDYGPSLCIWMSKGESLLLWLSKFGKGYIVF